MTAITTSVHDDADQLARHVADQFLDIVTSAIDRNGRAIVALAGGSTPKRLYQVLSTSTYRERIPWEKIHFFLSDERFVPLDHAESNYRTARETLLDHIPDYHSHPVQTDLEPDEAARRYEETIRDVFGVDSNGTPSFDLILLGIGGDGHTASLFPDTPALDVHDRLVIENWVPQQGSMRISFTIPLLQAAEKTIVMATGEDKADAVYRAIEGEQSIQKTPCQVLRDARGSVTFALDHAAASQLAQ